MTVQQKCNDFKQKKGKLTQQQLTSPARKTVKNLKKVINKKTVEGLAWESKFIQRITSKIMGFDFLASMLLASLDAEHATLEKICEILHSINPHVKITPQSIMERLNSEAAPCFFEMVLKRVLKIQLDSFASEIPPDLLKKFTKVLLQDSSSMDLNEKLSDSYQGSGGRASKASAKIDVIYDFKAKQYEHIKITDHSEADQKLGLNILDFLEPNALVIRDLGYLRMDCIIKIDAMKAFFLSRFKNNTCVYLNKEDENQLELSEYLYENHRDSRVVELEVYITRFKVPVRLIAYRVPGEVSAERRRKAHATAKKQGRTLTKKSLNLLEFSIFITNVPKETWPAEVVGTIYRIRWQIELLFKSWKSKLKIDYLKGINPNRIKVLLNVRMILVIIINEIYKLLNYIGNCISQVVSMHKVYNWMKCANRLKRILKGKLSWWEERHLADLIVMCMSKQKRNKKTSLQAIYEGDFYYQEAS
jgi:hypothetical protein